MKTKLEIRNEITNDGKSIIISQDGQNIIIVTNVYEKSAGHHRFDGTFNDVPFTGKSYSTFERMLTGKAKVRESKSTGRKVVIVSSWQARLCMAYKKERDTILQGSAIFQTNVALRRSVLIDLAISYREKVRDEKEKETSRDALRNEISSLKGRADETLKAINKAIKSRLSADIKTYGDTLAKIVSDLKECEDRLSCI